LVERLRAGEDEAFELLVAELWTPAVRFALRSTGDRDAAEDAAQEAFVVLYERRAELEPTGSVRAYLYQIIRNRLIDQARRASVRAQAARLAPPPAPASPHHALEGTEVKELVDRAVDQLPERTREAFMLAYLQDLSYREVATVMRISEKTVGHHVSAALAQLRLSLRPLLADGAPGAAPRRGREPRSS
jgi:RNA polymerase sigma-70 factor (ECF subfamily)